MGPAVFVGLAVALAVLVGVVVTVRSRRWREDRVQSYPDHVRRRAQPHEGGAVDEDTRTDQLLDELAEIAGNQGFLTMEGKDPRTREIGAELDRMNGMQKMLDVHSVVTAELGRHHARHLEAAWDGIGEWRG